MYGTLEAGLEVERTIKRAELTAFLCLLKKVHVDNKGILDGLWRGENKCIGLKAKDADMWIANKLRSKEVLIEVEHVRAHRTEKERQRMSLLEKFITEGNDKADELAKKEAIAVCSQFSLLGGGMERWHRARAQVKRKVDFRKGRKRSIRQSGAPQLAHNVA